MPAERLRCIVCVCVCQAISSVDQGHSCQGILSGQNDEDRRNKHTLRPSLSAF